METKKTYCGSGKKQNETWIKASINIDKIKDHIQEFNGHKFVKININIKDEADMYGKDVAISIDEWKPEKEMEMPKVKESSNDLPF